MNTKSKLFTRIFLENFMLHENTSVELAKEPIILITGANGSGKTQILDGVILCLGHIPTRAKAKGVGSLVGRKGKFAKVSLEVANPIINGRRAIHTLDKDLNSVIDFNHFSITAKISKEESNIRYYINDSRTIVRGRTVARRDIRRIFDSIGVRGDNRLAFTREGTVDEFASKSPKRKLDILLEVTGLKQYREEVIAAQEILRASIQEIEPLKRKLDTEAKLLNIWQDALKILKQKKQLMIMKTKLETELAWSHVVRVERQIKQLNQQRLKVLKERSDNEQAIQKKKDEKAKATRTLKALERRLQSVDEQEREKNRVVITLETKLNNERENIENFKREIQRYFEQKEKMEKILASKDLSIKDQKLRDKQEELTVKNMKLSLIQDKYSKAEKELQELRKKIIIESDFDELQTDEEIFTGKRLTRFEEGLANAATIFYRKLKERSLTEEISGPIISLIKMKEGKKAWENAVKNLIGRNLYAFLAKSDAAYREAKRIYDETWPRWKPPLSVFKVSKEDVERADEICEKPNYREIADLAANLIAGDPYAVGFLKRIITGAVAEDKYDPNTLTAIARSLHKNILTKSCQSYYLSLGGFSRPPAPMKNPLGWRIRASKERTARFSDTAEERKIRVAIARLEKEIRELKIDEIKTLNDLSRIHQDIQALGMPDEKLLGKIETINEIINVIELKIKECKKHEQELQQNLKQAIVDFDSYKDQKEELLFKIKAQQEVSESLKLELYSLTEKESRLNAIELTFDSDFEKINEELKEKETSAKKRGDRPEEIRDYPEVRDELSRIEGHLESIGISDVDEDKIEAQKAKVDSLKKYMYEREEHITNLRADLEARLAFWSGELQEVITNISRSMKLLLGGIFEKVRLKVTNINNPEESGLFIEAVTKGEKYRDFRELSGGERVLAVEGLILAMHTLTDSPIHAIDEFTQRLDEKNKALAFSIAVRTQKLAGENSRFCPQFILLCPEALNVDLTDNIHHLVVSELKVIKAEHN